MYAITVRLSFVVCAIINLYFIEAVSFRKPVDLTWSFENSTLYWPGIQQFKFTKQIAKNTDKNYWYAMNEFCAGEHGGTHLDAPYHFYEHGWKVGDIPLDRFVVKGVLVDMSKEVEENGAPRNLQEEDLVNWEKNYGPIQDNSVVLVKFGWSKFYPDKNLYLGYNDTNNMNFPGVSAAAAQWLATKTKIVGVGVDTASVDAGNSESFDAHRILSHSNMYILENVKLLNNTKIPVRNFTLLVMPMNIALGTGAPLRLMAIPDHYSII